MSAKIIDGKQIAADLRINIKKRVQQRLDKGLKAPGLAVVLIGEDPASQIYVRNKRRGCEETGIISEAYDLPATTTLPSGWRTRPLISSSLDVPSISVTTTPPDPKAASKAPLESYLSNAKEEVPSDEAANPSNSLNELSSQEKIQNIEH